MLDSFAVTKQRAEQASAEDLLQGDVLLLASGSWNTGGAEGQMNPYLDELLKKKAVDIDLAGKKVFLIGLGDDRYRYTVGCLRYMTEFVTTHNGVLIEPVLRIVNEPYGQEEIIKDWVREIGKQFSAFSV